MKLNKIGLIISREYSVRVKKKSFILTTLLTPVLMALLITVPSLIMIYGGDKAEQVYVVDKTGMMEAYFENSKKIEYTFLPSNSNIEHLKSTFDTLGGYALVAISAFDEKDDVAVTAYSKEPLNMDIKVNICDNVEKAIRDYRLARYNIENLDRILEEVKAKVSINAITISGDGSEKKDTVEVYMVLSYILSFLIYMFVFMFGTMVMRGVIEEKTNRIVEVIVSSVSSFELMLGKIIGVAAVALTQFAIWIVLTIGLVGLVGGIAGQDILPSVTESAQVSAVGNLPGINNPADSELVQSIAEKGGEPSVIQDIMIQVSNIDFPYIIGCFLVYFLLGYLLYASLFAAVGSAVDNEADTNQLSLPITIPLIIGLFIMLHTFQYPSSDLSVWASIIPFTSPMVMLARIPFGSVPGWQLFLSIFLLFVTFIGTTYISGKIYRIGILTYGKKATFKDLYKWIKYKN